MSGDLDEPADRAQHGEDHQRDRHARRRLVQVVLGLVA